MVKRYSIPLLGLLVVLCFSTAFATKNVTFQVNMGVQAQLGTFKLGADTVVVRGDWEHYISGQSDWSGYFFRLTKSTTNDSIYTVTVAFPDSVASKVLQYKFVTTKGGNDNWESIANNRTYTVTSDGNQTIALVFFNDRTSVGVTHFVTFQADMTDLIAAGFNPATDSIEVRGGANELTNWGNGVRLTKSLLNANLYQVKISMTFNPTDSVQYKFHCDPQAKFDNTGWENTAGNRVLYFADNDIVIPAVKPVITVLNIISKNVTVTFNVDMTNARERYHNTLITGLTGVYLAGAASPLQWPSAWTYTDTASTGGTLIKLNKPASGNVWSVNVTFLASNNVSKNLQYKYGAVFTKVDTLNGGTSYLDNEAGYSVNHAATLNDATGTQMINDRFGGQIVSVEKDPSASIPVTFTLAQNYPNPFNPTTTIRYTVPKAAFVSLKVYNMLGQEVETLVNQEQTPGSFVVQFDASRLSSGVYLYRLASGTFSDTKKLVLLK